MNAMVGFIPWIVFWILVGSVSFRAAAGIAFALTIVTVLLPKLRGKPLHSLEIGGAVVFGLLVIVAFATDDRFLERWIQPLTNGGLLLVALAGVLAGRPFTLEYAREAVTPEVAGLPGFLYINRIITWVWIGAFVVMTAASLLPPIFEGDATLDDDGSTLSIVGYWVIPYTVLGLAGIFTARFPDWFTSAMDAPPAPARTPVPARDEPAAPLAPGTAGRLALTARPARALSDEAPAVALTGAEPGERVALEARTIDAFGREWRARAAFEAGADGAVETGRDAPSSGDWTGPDPAGPLWSMVPSDGGLPELFIPPDDAASVEVSATAGEAAVGATLVRLSRGGGVRTEELRGDGFAGRLFLPDAPGPTAGVALFGGSEGGLDSQSGAAGLLASRGYAALVVAYFGADGLPATLERIPLESFAAGIRALAARPEVDPARIAGMAISKGSEGLLAAAAHLPDVPLRGLVAVSPSHVVWQAIGDQGASPDTPSWTLAGRDLPFAPVAGEAVMPEMLRNAALRGWDRRRHRPTLMHLLSTYALDDEAALSAARIPVERIGASMLLVSGDDDELWPSGAMAAAIAARRDNGADVARAYPGAGHFFRPPYLPTTATWSDEIAFGGEPGPTAKAHAGAWAETLGFLRARVD